jgi:natural resistance-associated macrophage protein
LQAEAVAMATDLAEFVGAALALNLVFGVPMLPAGMITEMVAFIVLGLQVRGHRPFERAIAALLLIVTGGFAYELLRIQPSPLGLTSRRVIAGEQHLRVILSEYIGHYDTGRSHQGHGMALRAPDDAPDIIAFPVPAARIQRRARFAGLINEYRPAA